MITIWHHPRCTKSRATLALLEQQGLAPRIRLYLQDPPDAAQIRAVLRALNRPPLAIMRRAEPAFRNRGLTADSDDADLVAAMAACPILIQRPIVINGDRAAIGRPPEAVRAIL